MSDWQKVKIGKLFSLEKGNLQSSKCTPGQFDFITAASDWKTHKAYDKDCEALIIAVAASGSLGRTHYVNGKFVSSDLCFIMTPKDFRKFPIDLKFYHFVFNSFREEIVRNTKSGTSKESINRINLQKYELPYFNIELQRLWIERLIYTKSIKTDLVTLITHQQSLLKKLRQAILQEATEGKLTKQWREENTNVEPASALLEKIKAEKARLAEKKIKEAKPLPPIEKDEIPFEIPESWEWCRLGEYALFERGRFSVRPRNDPSYYGGIYPFIQIGSLDSRGSVVYIYTQTLNKRGLSVSKMFEKGSIVMAIVGGTIGNMGVLGLDMCFPDSMVGVRPKQETCQDYILILLKYFHPIIRELSYQMAGQPNIKLPTLNNLKSALPPLREQKEIVKKVDHLFAMCDELEGQINDSKANADMLMQAVLKEAFAQ